MKTPESFDIGKGWHPLIAPILEYIDTYNSGRPELQHIHIVQIKEKWGILHIYTDGVTDELGTLIFDAMEKSKTICQECGKPATLRKVSGWYVTLCDYCI